MVILDCYGKITPICISNKLGLFIANIPKEEGNNCLEWIINEIDLAVKFDRYYKKIFNINFPCGIKNLYTTLFPNEILPNKFTRDNYNKIAEHMIYIYQEYDYQDMPLGGFETNCFDDRYCEEEYAEKIINFIQFISHMNTSTWNIPEPVPQWVYSSNHFDVNYSRIFYGGKPAREYIVSLQKWGNILDDFLKTRNDYLLFDYLVNMIYKHNGCDMNHLIKAYSLCQLFLEKDKEIELDKKLPNFLNCYGENKDKKYLAELLRKMRNKIAHGDFIGFENLVEIYANEFLDKDFDFDYTEYSRKNWVLLNVCCLLDDVVRKLICMLLFNKDELYKIKFEK